MPSSIKRKKGGGAKRSMCCAVFLDQHTINIIVVIRIGTSIVFVVAKGVLGLFSFNEVVGRNEGDVATVGIGVKGAGEGSGALPVKGELEDTVARASDGGRAFLGSLFCTAGGGAISEALWKGQNESNRKQPSVIVVHRKESLESKSNSIRISNLRLGQDASRRTGRYQDPFYFWFILFFRNMVDYKSAFGERSTTKGMRAADRIIQAWKGLARIKE